MMRSFWLIVCFLGMIQSVAAGGEFARALPGYPFEFPRDHGAHPAFRTEWWYFTGNLTGGEGERFGFELTFFRTQTALPGDPIATRSPLVADSIQFAHFAISAVDEKSHTWWERIGRPGFAQASASTTGLNVRQGPWHAVMDGAGTITLKARAPDHDIDLQLMPVKPLVVHGAGGVHQKAADPGQASHYISFTRLATRGTLTWQGRTCHVEGQSWMDHEFGSDQLSEDQIGWDWFAIQLDSGEELMVYQIRRRDGAIAPQSTGTRVATDGTSSLLSAESYRIETTGRWESPDSGAVYPMGWIIHIPEQQADLIVTPAFEAQEMRTTRTTGGTYWEGAVEISGRWLDRPAQGRGYVELVGYGGEFSTL